MKEVYVDHTNIISALGFDTISNIAQISNEVSGVRMHDDTSILPNPFQSSMINQTQLQQRFDALKPSGDYTRLEKMMLLSLKDIIDHSKVALTEKTVLIVSTTKGNVDALASNNSFPEDRAYLSQLGKQIQSFFGLTNEAIVVSNACVSGILAVVMAKRLIQNGSYDNALVVGGDLVTPFILSGFNSFQAISPDLCQPFSKNRKGINIGEAAASVLVTCDPALITDKAVKIVGDGSCNDANHISGPSRTGEGLYRSIASALTEADIEPTAVQYISAHGTATMYNDEMEAIAMNRSGLENVPINSLKGYYGHTLGASGLLETIVGIHSIQNNVLYASKGFDELGVTPSINVIAKTQAAPVDTFMKTASGFGGCNTAAIFTKKGITGRPISNQKSQPTKPLKIAGYCHIAKNTLSINGKVMQQEREDLIFAEFAKKVYKDNELGYPKFFKMDKLSKLAFLGAEFLFRESNILSETNDNNIALVFSNRASSLDTDRKHQSSIDDATNYFPSPAVFVYTLPNICLGEISIRHQLKSENAFCIFDQMNPDFLWNYSQALIQNKKADRVLCAWVDFDNEQYEAFMYLVSPNGDMEHSKETIIQLSERQNG